MLQRARLIRAFEAHFHNLIFAIGCSRFGVPARPPGVGRQGCDRTNTFCCAASYPRRGTASIGDPPRRLSVKRLEAVPAPSTRRYCRHIFPRLPGSSWLCLPSCKMQLVSPRGVDLEALRCLPVRRPLPVPLAAPPIPAPRAGRERGLRRTISSPPSWRTRTRQSLWCRSLFGHRSGGHIHRNRPTVSRLERAIQRRRHRQGRVRRARAARRSLVDLLRTMNSTKSA